MIEGLYSVILVSGTFVPGTKWRLTEDLLVTFHTSELWGVVASDVWIEEYGHGKTKEDAVLDLLLSMVELRESLERRVTYGHRTLSDGLQRELNYLQRIFTLNPAPQINLENWS